MDVSKWLETQEKGLDVRKYLEIQEKGQEAERSRRNRAMETVSRDKRMVHYDLLRIVAAFSVVMLHSAGQKWYVLPVTDRQWQIADAWDALFRFGVPIFVMISGAIFLNKDISIKRLYFHNIFRLLAIYWIWSGLYGLYDCRKCGLGAAEWKEVIKELLGGRYHLWFLPMIVAVYMLVPILRSWIKGAEKRNLQYFLLLFFFLKIGMFTMSALSRSYIVRYVSDLTNVMELGMACSYIGYFVWGYYITHYGIPEKWHRVIYAGVIPAALLNLFVDRYLSLKAGEPRGEIYDSYGVFTFIIVTALFLFFTNVMSKVHYSRLAAGIIRELSEATLGVYVMHVGLLEVLEERGIDTMLVPNIIGIPLLAMGCYAVCTVAAVCLRRIPVIGRYLC